LPRSWQADRNVQGQQLTLRNGDNQILEFSKGLGTQAFTQLDFSNDKDYKHFKAIIGIDSATNGRGDCRMAIRGDGVELWSSRVKGSDPPQDVDIEISNFKIISLIVYAGEAFDLADHANWCNARFVK
jgi:hypothetical protein